MHLIPLYSLPNAQRHYRLLPVIPLPVFQLAVTLVFSLLLNLIWPAMSSAAPAIDVLHTFGRAAGQPTGSPVRDAAGNLYGVAAEFHVVGALGGSTIYRLSATDQYTVLHTFDAAAGLPGRLALRSGVLYGVTPKGGAADLGTIFRLDSDGGNFLTVHEFSAAEGASDGAGLTLGADGNLYGITVGNTAAAGAAFRLDGSDNYAVAHAFSASDGRGSNPQFGLTAAPDQSLYGITRRGGAANAGTVYKLDASGAHVLLHEFQLDFPGSLERPASALTRGPDGTLYGLTSDSSTNQTVLYQIDTTGTFSKKQVLSGIPEIKATVPAIGGDGALYFTLANFSARFVSGSVNRLDEAGTGVPLTPPGEFRGGPAFALTDAGDGSLYGATVATANAEILSSDVPVSVLYRVRAGTQSRVNLMAGPNNPVAPGEAVPLTATVEGNAPTGAVTFLDGTTVLGSASLQNGVATFTINTLAPGTHTLSARYEGDANNPVAGSTVLTLNVASGPRTAPLISYRIEGAAGANGWYTSGVSLVWTVTEQQGWPLIPSQTQGCDSPRVIGGETPGTTFTCSATSAGGTTAESVRIRIDTSAPAMTCPADVNVVRGQPVPIGVPTVVDSMDPSPTVRNNAPASFPAGTTIVTWSAVNAAGLAATPCAQKVTVTVPIRNKAPRAVDDLVVVRLKGATPVTIAAPGVLSNDSDPEGAKLTVAGTTRTLPRIISLDGGRGTVALYQDGRLAFTPSARRLEGGREFSYRVSDGQTLSAPAKVALIFRRR